MIPLAKEVDQACAVFYREWLQKKELINKKKHAGFMASP
jgi:hypothetical protein